jgi:hypothetical protein
MKILILGLGKTGTTALLHKIAGGLPNCHAFSGGKPGKYIGNYENAVYKHTYSERKGKSFNLYQDHLRKEHYDRKVWIARDPRDAAISKMLFRWHKGYFGKKRQYQAHLELVLKKERNPKSISFSEICRYTNHGKWPVTPDELIKKESRRYLRMRDFVKSLGPEWMLFKYEDMVDKKFDALNNYLGFKVKIETEVPKTYGKVVRKKSTGDWRHWFTEEDVELFKPAYLPYMELIGYDCDDWALAPDQTIEPEYSSIYMQSLPKRLVKDTIFRYRDQLFRLIKASGKK